MKSNPDLLNDRELEILACLVEGLSNREIAAKLFLTYQTVKWYNSQIYSKLGVSSRDEAVEHAIARGLLESEAETTQQNSKHNLPQSLTEFVGRSQEIHDLQELLASRQLITILAPGGMGKTRLSLELARTQVGNFADGVYFVPLAPLTFPDDIVTTIAENIAFVFHGENPPVQQLVNYLKEREILLVLDNLEHLLDGAELVNEIIQSSTNVKIIVTSRERLNLRGENVYTPGGLKFPEWETPEDAMAYDAVKLFMQSAGRVRADFELNSDDLDFLARICRLTAGMPLGIELAAGWVDVLSLEQIANEIQKGIDILETDMRDVPERHRSLRATFERSWERLTESEQAIFAKLSVFRGGFTLDSAGEVAGATIRDLKRLSQKALIQSEQKERYAIHELLRQYAEEHLQLSGEMDSIKKRHADYYSGLFEPLGNSIWGSFNTFQNTLVLDLNPDFENARSAWQFNTGIKNIKGLQDALNGIWMFMDLVSRSQEAVNMLEEVLAEFINETGNEGQLFRAQVNARRAWFYCDLGQRKKAMTIVKDAILALEKFDSADGILMGYTAAERILWFMGHQEDHLALIEKAYELASQMEHSRWYKYYIQVRTQNYYDMGKYDEALRWELSRPLDEQNIWEIGRILYQQGKYQEAEPYLLQAREIMLQRTPTGSRHFYSTILYYAHLAEVNLYTGNYPEGKYYLKQALIRCDNVTYIWVTLEVLELALDVLILEEKFSIAIEIVSTIMSQSDETGFVRNRAVKHIEQLQASVAPDVYDTAWEKGQNHHLDSLVADLLAELEDES